jgi:hypothetical protein
MATKEQYEFFRSLYDEEEARYSQLEARARLYLAVISAFIAAIVLKANEIKQSIRILGGDRRLLAVATLLVASLVMIVISTKIRQYEGIADPREIIENFGPAPPSNEEFFDLRLADLTVATERNAKVNDQVARFLAWAGVLLALAMVALLLFLVFSFFTSP